MNNLQENGWNFSDLKYISLPEKTKEQFLVKKGDVLFNRTNSKELVGKCDVFREDGEWIFASYLIRVRFNKEKALSQFVSDFLGTKAGRLQIDRVSRQIIGMSNVNAEELKDLQIPLPPLEIQRALVEEMERARETRRGKLFEADALLQSLDGWLLDVLSIAPPPADNRQTFAVKLGTIKNRLDVHANQSRFRRLFELIRSMKTVRTVDELSEDVFSGITPLAGGSAYVEPPNGVSFVRSGEIGSDGVACPTNEIHISQEIHETKMKRSQLRRGDVLIAIVGATIGKVGVYDSDEPANINQAIASVRFNEKILPMFFVVYLKSLIGQQILDFLKRPVARANINIEEIKSIPVPVLDKAIQQEIVEKFDALRVESRRLRVEAEAEWQAAKDKFEAALLGGGER